ncbi:MAG TPA: gamma-glutamyltransferase [Woeseiaceae bacterium]
MTTIHRRKLSRLLLLGYALTIALTACSRHDDAHKHQQPARQAAVAMPDAHAANVAAAILGRGGNAVDAAVAVGFSLAVTYPEAGNIGGGGFMVLYMDGQPWFLDYREVAPAAAHRDMYLDEDGEVIPDLSFIGHKASGVPGTVAGLWAAHQRFGTLPWSELLQPAIDLAANGFVPHPELAARAAESVADYGEQTNFAEHFGRLRASETFVQKDLAEALTRIANEGPKGFYQGETAQLIAAEMQRGGGLITLQDLEQYQPVWRKPLLADWRDYRVIASPPPSSGGFAVIQMLKLRDALAAAFTGLEHNSPQYIHLLAEIAKRTFADRAEYLGDPDYSDVDVGQLLDDDYVERRAAEVNLESISLIDSVRPGLESRTTTHFSIMDAEGNAVANTYTVNDWFGSRVVAAGAGFVMNNQMDDFSVKPGVPNYYGVIGYTANEIQPGKRMLSSMSPTILLRGNQVAMVLGAEGGSKIITCVFQTILNVADFGMSAQQALDQDVFHHQLLPEDTIDYSPGRNPPRELLDALENKGYALRKYDWVFGDVQLIVADADGLHPASDPQGRGKSVVVEITGDAQ